MKRMLTAVFCLTLAGAATWTSLASEPVATQTTPTVGACCTADGNCQVLEPAECSAQNGNYIGDFTSCETGTCFPPSADELLTWGRIKVRYRR